MHYRDGGWYHMGWMSLWWLCGVAAIAALITNLLPGETPGDTTEPRAIDEKRAGLQLPLPFPLLLHMPPAHF
jgi:hypothetical protein